MFIFPNSFGFPAWVENVCVSVCSSGWEMEIKIILWFTVSRIKINPQAVAWGIVVEELIFLFEIQSVLPLFVSSCFLYSLDNIVDGLSTSEQNTAHTQMPQSLWSPFFVIVFTTSFYFREQRRNDISS